MDIAITGNNILSFFAGMGVLAAGLGIVDRLIFLPRRKLNKQEIRLETYEIVREEIAPYASLTGHLAQLSIVMVESLRDKGELSEKVEKSLDNLNNYLVEMRRK